MLNDSDYQQLKIINKYSTEAVTFKPVPNYTENCTLFHQYPPELLDFGAACCIIFAIVGIIGNFATVFALTCSPHLRNATTAFIVNLSVADFLFSSFSLPLSAVTFLEREWSYGDILCKLFALFRYSNATVSLLSVVAITVNRYVLIVYPRKYTLLYRTSYIALMIAIIWIASLLLLAFPLFEIWGKLGYDPKVGTCSILPLNGKSPKMFLYAAAFFIPSVVMIFCYGRIFWVVRKSGKIFERDRKQSMRTCSERISFTTTKWGIFKTRRVSKMEPQASLDTTTLPHRNKRELRVLRITLVIFITFFFSYFPVSFVKAFRKEDDLPVMNIFGYLGVYFTSCINPIIYVAMSKEYRQAYKNLFTCTFKKSDRSIKRQIRHNGV